MCAKSGSIIAAFCARLNPAYGGPGHPLQPGSGPWRIHSAIAPIQGELIVGKREPDSFFETTLQQELASRNIRKLIITGIQTELCVDTTCGRAASLGYEVALVADGHSTWGSRTLSAAQIIAHHNDTLKGWFATPKPASDIAF